MCLCEVYGARSDYGHSEAFNLEHSSRTYNQFQLETILVSFVFHSFR